MGRTTRRVRWLLPALLGASLLSGCLAAAAVGAAGAAGAVLYTQRGASSLVQGSIDEVFRRAQAVFRQMRIAETGQATENSGAQRTLLGTHDGMEVTVELKRESATTTQVEVYARRSLAEWDREFARSVLTRLVEAS